MNKETYIFVKSSLLGQLTIFKEEFDYHSNVIVNSRKYIDALSNRIKENEIAIENLEITYICCKSEESDDN